MYPAYLLTGVFFNIKSNMLTETKHNHKVLPILTKTLNPLKSGIQSLQKDTNEEGIKRRETLNHCVVQLKHRIRFTLFSAKLFPINQYIFFFFLLSTYPLCCTQNLLLTKKLPFPLTGPKTKRSFPNLVIM